MLTASVCVYCGSRDGRDPRFAEAAEATGRMIAANGWGLVYGAGDVGLMGRVARAHQAAGGRALGVIPGHLFPREVAKRDIAVSDAAALFCCPLTAVIVTRPAP